MFWKFWEKTKAGEERLPGPKEIPNDVGRFLVVDEKQDSNLVWNLKGVVRPTEKKSVFYCRVFNISKTAQAGVKIRDWNSLNEHPDLIIWEGYFDKNTHEVFRQKFAGP